MLKERFDNEIDVEVLKIQDKRETVSPDKIFRGNTKDETE